MPDIELCIPNNNYIIVERVQIVYTTHTPGASFRKVTRHVAQTCDKQDMFYNGELVDGIPTPWQYLMDALSFGEITYQPNGQRSVVLIYAGFENLLRPLPAEFNISIVPEPLEFLFEEHNVPTTGLFVYGEDPIPDVRLFNDPSAYFIAAGGNGNPTAMAVYYGDTGRLEHVLPDQVEIMLQQLGVTQGTSP